MLYNFDQDYLNNLTWVITNSKDKWVFKIIQLNKYKSLEIKGIYFGDNDCSDRFDSG